MALRVEIEKRLRGFTLQAEFEAGSETMGLLGASGSGKSMTLRCVAGIEKPDRGRIILDGRTLFDSERGINLSPQERNVGLMFQHYALFPHMTVKQNILCGMKGRKGPETERRAAELMEAFGLTNLAERRPSQISGGQQQRTALARILAGDPELLMLDEPFSALDSHLRFQTEREVRQVIRRFGKTVLLVSHNRDEIYRMADRVAIFREGQIERQDTREALFRDPGTRAGCMLTGCKNLSAFTPEDGRHGYASDWGVHLTLPLREGTDAVGIRMHSIRPGRGPSNTFRCRVSEVIENPFSITVMLRPEEAPPGADPIGWEMEKGTWESLRAESLVVHMPEEKILQLRG